MSSVDFEGIASTLALWRQQGSTTAAATAAFPSGTLVVHDYRFVRWVKDHHGNERVLTLKQLGDYAGGPRTGPLVVDHWVLYEVAMEGHRYQAAYVTAETERKVLQQQMGELCLHLAIVGRPTEVSQLRAFNDTDGLLRGVTKLVEMRDFLSDTCECQAAALREIRAVIKRDTVVRGGVRTVKRKAFKRIQKVIDDLTQKKVEGAPT